MVSGFFFKQNEGPFRAPINMFSPVALFQRLGMLPTTPLMVAKTTTSLLIRRTGTKHRALSTATRKRVTRPTQFRPCPGHRRRFATMAAGTLAATRGTAAAAGAGVSALPSPPTGVPGKNGAKAKAEDDNAFDALAAAAGRALGPLAGQLTFGTCLGCCAGYALKSVGRSAAFVVGVTFVGLQTLQYCGYININWGKVQKDVVGVFDKDGDGTVGRADLKSHWDSVMRVLRFNLPSSAGFGIGVALGIMYG